MPMEQGLSLGTLKAEVGRNATFAGSGMSIAKSVALDFFLRSKHLTKHRLHVLVATAAQLYQPQDALCA